MLYPDKDTAIQSVLAQLGGTMLCARPPAAFDKGEATTLLHTHFGVQSLEGFGCHGLTAGLGAAGAVWRYFRETQPTASLNHVRRVQRRWGSEAMHLDGATIRNLELVRPLGCGEGRQVGTLLSVLDRTSTAMGGRLLRAWLLRPLLDCRAIQARLDAVAELKDCLSQRVALGQSCGRSRIWPPHTRCRWPVRESARVETVSGYSPELRINLRRSGLPARALYRGWDDCREAHDAIEQAIHPTLRCRFETATSFGKATTRRR